MRSHRTLWLTVLALGLFILAQPNDSLAADNKPQGFGTITGSVVDSGGQPAANLAMKLYQDQPVGFGQGGGKKKKQDVIGTGNPTDLQAGPGGEKLITTVTTDAQGRFTFSNVKVGDYLLMAGSKSMGWIYQPVAVKANEETKLGQIKLAKTD